MDNPSQPAPALEMREHSRLGLRCRARIRIDRRAYMGVIANISEGGARIVTENPIPGGQRVTLQLPDLAPLHGELRWSRGCEGGVRFALKLDAATLKLWNEARLQPAA